MVQRLQGRIFLSFIFLACLVWPQTSEAKNATKCVEPELHSDDIRVKFTGRPGNFKLVCKVRKKAIVTSIKWYKNGQKIAGGKRVSPHRTIFKIRGPNDNGDFSCVVKNRCGFSNATYKLLIGKYPTFFEKIQRKTLIAVPYIASSVYRSPINLDCKAIGSPFPTVNWTKNGKPFTHRNKQPLNLGPHDFHVYMEAVPSDSGNYSCNVSNVNGWIARTYTVDVRERLPAGKPIIQPIANVTAKVGQNVTTTCNATSDAMAHIIWLRWLPTFTNSSRYEPIRQTPNKYNRIVLKTKSRFKYVEKLTLINVTKESEGKYTCIVGNSLGYNFEDMHLKVIADACTKPASSIKTRRSSINKLHIKQSS